MRTRWTVLVIMGLATGAQAEPSPAIGKKLAKKLARGGWKDPVLLLETPVQMLSAKQGRTRHVLVVGPKGALVDTGVARGTGTESAAVDRSIMVSAGTAVTVSYAAPRGSDGSETSSWIYLVRPDGTVACKLEGSSRTNPGTACGSGGWTDVTVEAAPGDPTLLEVTTEHTGTWSEPGASGQCRARSPVRSGPVVTRYAVPKRGTCKRQAATR